MNLVSRYTNLTRSKGYGGTGRGIGGSAYSDIQNKNRAPTALELIRELVGIAYACADINAGAVAANHLRLYARKSKAGTQTKAFRFPTRDIPQPNGRRGRKIFWRGKSTKTAAPGLEIGDDTDAVEVINHPILEVLQHPEAGPLALSAYAHTYITQFSLETLGVAYWRVDRDGAGIPIGFPFLPAQRVAPVIDYGTGQLTGYTFDRKPVPLDDIVRFSIPDLIEPHFRTASPTMATYEKICIGRRMDARLSALMQNAARPDALFVPKGDSEGGGIGEYEARRVRGAMRQAFSEAGTGGVMVSEFPGALQILGWKPGDVVEIERAKLLKTDIENCYGIPNAMMDLNEANLASAKAAEFQHSVRTVGPRCTRYQDTLTMSIVPLFDKPKSGASPLFFAYDSTVPDDEVFELETAKVAGQIALATVDEGRASAGLAPIGGKAGAMRYMNGVPLDEDGMPIQAAAAPPVPGVQSGNEPKPQPAPFKPGKPVTPGSKSHKPSDTEWNEDELRKAIAGIEDEVTIDHDHLIPWVAGTSNDLKTVYIDKDIPEKYFGPLTIHELAERALVDTFHLPYDEGHQLACKLERAAVEAAGMNWAEYQDAMDGYIHADEGEPLPAGSVPAQLWLVPYEDDSPATLRRVRAAMPSNGHGKTYGGRLGHLAGVG